MAISKGVILDNNPLAWSTVGPSDGDLFILFFYNDGGDNQSTPSDLTRLDSNGGSTMEAGAYYRVCDTTETGNVFTDEEDFAVSKEGYNAHWFLIPAVEWHGSTLPEMPARAGGGSGTVDPPSNNPSGWDASAEDTIWIICGGRDDDDGLSAVSSGYSTNEQLSESGNQVEVGSSYRIAATGTENPGTYTHVGTAEEWVAYTIAIRPGGPLPPIIPMGAVTLASSPQGLDLITGAIGVEMQEATLASSPQALVVSAPLPSQTVVMGIATLASSPQTLGVIAGAISVPMSEADLVSSSQALTLALGTVSVLMSAATLASSAQAIESVTSVPPAQTIDLLAVTITGSVQSLDIVPGATTVEMSEATLAGSPQSLTVVAAAGPQTIPLSAIMLFGSPQALIILASVILNMQEITAVGSPQSLSVSAPSVVGLPSFRAVGRGVLRGVGRGM